MEAVFCALLRTFVGKHRVPRKLQLDMAKMLQKPVFALPGCQPISVNTILRVVLWGWLILLPFAPTCVCTLLHSFVQAASCIWPCFDLGTSDISILVCHLSLLGFRAGRVPTSHPHTIPHPAVFVHATGAESNQLKSYALTDSVTKKILTTWHSGWFLTHHHLRWRRAITFKEFHTHKIHRFSVNMIIQKKSFGM